MNPPTAVLRERPASTDNGTPAPSPPTPGPGQQSLLPPSTPAVDESARAEPTPPDSARREPAPDEPEQPGRERTVGRRLRSFLTFLLAVVLIGALAVGAFVAWTLLDERLNEDAATDSANFGALDERVAADEELIAELQSQVATLEAEAAAVPGRIDELDQRLTELATDQTATEARIDDVQGRIDEGSARLDALDRAQQDLTASASAVVAELRVDLEVARSTELMSRARLYLYQANYGLAIDDISSARAILMAIEPVGDRLTAEVRDATVVRLDQALEALPDRPVLAADDLDIAWQLLMGDIPVQVAASPGRPVLEPAEPAADGDQPAEPDTGETDPQANVPPVDESTADDAG